MLDNTVDAVDRVVATADALAGTVVETVVSALLELAESIPLVSGIATTLKALFATYKLVRVFQDDVATFATRVMALSQALVQLLQVLAPRDDTVVAVVVVQAPPQLETFRSLLADANRLIKVGEVGAAA